MNGTSGAVLNRDDATIHYRRLGQGPPLMLLHATLSSSRQLRRLATRLAARFTVYAVDRRESGESRLPDVHPAAPIDVAVHVADLVALVANEHIGPVLAVGHSYGGCLALELAARHPALVSGVWVYEPPYAPLGPASVRGALTEAGQRTAEANRRGGYGAAAEAFLKAVAGRDVVASLSPAARARVRGAGRAAVADATLSGMDANGLAAIRCAVMVASGIASEPVYAELAGALSRRIADCRTVRFEGVDHSGPITQPDVVAASIEVFANR